MITDPTVDDTKVSPKLSPRKYRNGSNIARRIKYFLSPFRIGVNPFVIHKKALSKVTAMQSLIKTMVIGS